MPFQLRTNVCDMLGMQYPIFAFTHKVQVVIAISRAGGFPVYGATRDTPEEIEQVVREVRAAIGNRPFGLNLVLPEGMPDEDNRDVIEAQIPERHRQFVKGLVDKYEVPRNTKPAMRTKFIRSKEMNQRQIDTVMNSDVPLLAFGIGAPPEVVQEAHRRGKKVLALVGNPKHAVRAINKGVDLIVAQGHESAAHTGNITTFSLVPQVVDVAGNVPVLAAGGVATGRHIMAALAMGAQGVWCGTSWLLTKEWGLDPIIQEKLAAIVANKDAIIADMEFPFDRRRYDWATHVVGDPDRTLVDAAITRYLEFINGKGIVEVQIIRWVDLTKSKNITISYPFIYLNAFADAVDSGIMYHMYPGLVVDSPDKHLRDRIDNIRARVPRFEVRE